MDMNTPDTPCPPSPYSDTGSNRRTYIAIDLKSYYASVECVARGLNPLKTNLVVADPSRTEKTICLAVTPSLKAFGIPGRARLFEVVQKLKEVNALRRIHAPGGEFTGESCDATELAVSPHLAVSYIVAPPRMAYYMQCSTQVYRIYLKYVSHEDILVYSIDEVFIDVTHYLQTYGLTPRELAAKMIKDVYDTCGITATAGIGTNMFLCKVAMDVMAKRVQADENGVRIAELDERRFREEIWNHRPITDIWRVGRGYAKCLAEYGMFTMGDIARCSAGGENDFYNEELLYRIFGVNAELLIDHAWGYEPCTIAEAKTYKPKNSSISSGQVLQHPYDCEKTRLVVREMTDLLVLDLVEQGLATSQIVLTIGYDIDNLTNPEIKSKYRGEVTIDGYGRRVPKHAHGTENLPGPTSSTKEIMAAVERLYDRIINPDLLTRRITVVAAKIEQETEVECDESWGQLDLFTDYGALEREKEAAKEERAKEKKVQQALLDIKKKFGKNAVLRGMNLKEGATAKERNSQVGGHKA